MNLKNQLRFYLEYRNLTAARLARQAGVPKQSISDWLAGASPRKLEQLKKIASHLGVSIDHLCFGEGNHEHEITPVSLSQILGEQWVQGTFEIKIRRIGRSYTRTGEKDSVT